MKWCLYFRNRNVKSILPKFTFRWSLYEKQAIRWILSCKELHIIGSDSTTIDRILMENTCELPWMGSRKYFFDHKSFLRDVSGVIDSLPTCEWRSDIYHLRINIMRVCFQTVESHRYSCLL